MKAQVQVEYSAVRQGMGICELTSRGKILAQGPDRLSFLQSVVTNDVEGLDEFRGCYTAFLTPRGKLVADFFIYRFPEFLVLDVDNSRLEKLVRSLEQLIVMDEVSLQDETAGWAHLSVIGPNAQPVVEEVYGVAAPERNLTAMAPTDKGDWLIRKNDLDPVGFELLVTPGNKERVKQALYAEAASRGPVAVVRPELRNILRIERGIPEFGQDMDETNYPMEARLDSAISLTKGCYVGQEVVSKATWVGGVSRLLMGLRISGDDVPAKGAEITNDSGEVVGHLTSAAWSPKEGQPLGLGYVKKAHARSGASLRVILEDGKKVSVEVVDRVN